MNNFTQFQIGGGPQGGGKSPFGGIGALIMLVLFLGLGYFLIKGLFSILSIVAPLLLIITAFVDYSVITNYGKFLMKMLKDKPLIGILGIVLTVVGFPFVAGFLLVKALLLKKVKSMMPPQEGEAKSKEEDFSDYEEIQEEDFSDYEELELPKVEVQQPKESNDYDNLFK